jgi:hypothetical protein
MMNLLARERVFNSLFSIVPIATLPFVTLNEKRSLFFQSLDIIVNTADSCLTSSKTYPLFAAAIRKVQVVNHVRFEAIRA